MFIHDGVLEFIFFSLIVYTIIKVLVTTVVSDIVFINVTTYYYALIQISHEQLKTKQLLQLCTARTASSDLVIRSISVRFGNLACFGPFR